MRKKDVSAATASVALVAVLHGLCGCWSPVVVGEPMSDGDDPIYGIHLQPLIGFGLRKVVGLNVAARMEPDVSGDRKPNASAVTGLAVGVVHHEVRNDVNGVQVFAVCRSSESPTRRGLHAAGFRLRCLETVRARIAGRTRAAACRSASETSAATIGSRSSTSISATLRACRPTV